MTFVDILLIIGFAELMCNIILPRYKLVKHNIHNVLYHPKKRVFLFFYKSLKVDTAESQWGRYCYRECITDEYSAKRIIEQDKLGGM